MQNPSLQLIEKKSDIPKTYIWVGLLKKKHDKD